MAEDNVGRLNYHRYSKKSQAARVHLSVERLVPRVLDEYINKICQESFSISMYVLHYISEQYWDCFAIAVDTGTRYVWLLFQESNFILIRLFPPSPPLHLPISHFFSVVSDTDMMGSLLVELTKPKFLFRSELLGRTSVPLISVRHSNKVRKEG